MNDVSQLPRTLNATHFAAAVAVIGMAGWALASVAGRLADRTALADLGYYKGFPLCQAMAGPDARCAGRPHALTEDDVASTSQARIPRKAPTPSG